MLVDNNGRMSDLTEAVSMPRDEPSSTRLRVAVIGTGFGVLTDARALRAGFDVVALVGRDPDRTAERAAMFDIPLALTSIDEALLLPGLDAVTIATPPHTHAEIALAAIAAGKHIICEKPFARDAHEARTICEAADTAGIVHLLGTEFRWSPAQALLTRIVNAGRVGAPRLVTILLHIPLLADESAEVPEWWSQAQHGGGWLGAHASHVIDQVRVTVGEFEGVSASLPHVADHEWTAEDSYVVHFRTRSGAAGVLVATASDRGPLTFETRVVGSTGTAWLAGEQVMVADAAGTHSIPMPADLALAAGEPPPAVLMRTAYDLLHSTGTDLAPYTSLAETFRALIEGRDVPDDPRPATFADGVAGMVVLDAIRASAAQGSAWVRVDGD